MSNLRLPSPAMVVSLVALVVALGGTSYAALTITGKQVKNNSLTGADVKNGSLTGSDVKNGSLRAADFLAADLPRGATGAQGPKGDTGAKGDKGDAGAQGAPGTARAYAQVDDGGPSLVTARTSGITSVTRPATGVYCFTVDAAISSQVFDAGGSPIRATVASVEFGNTTGITAPNVQVRGANATCGDNFIEVHTFDGATAVNTVSFTVIVP